MNLQQISANLTATILVIIVLVPILTLSSNAYYANHPSVYDLSLDIVLDQEISNRYYTYLHDNGWINYKVTRDDFYFIYTLVDQLTYGDEHVTKNLILAQIALESRFDSLANSGSAIGLMQLVPLYHQNRLSKFTDEDRLVDLDDFYNPRLNIATGIDYMQELMESSDYNEIYALMKYNQGPASAYHDYVEQGYISYYAETITNLRNDLDKI